MHLWIVLYTAHKRRIHRGTAWFKHLYTNTCQRMDDIDNKRGRKQRERERESNSYGNAPVLTNIFISCRCCLCAICLQTTYIYALAATPPASLAAYHQYLQTRYRFRAKIAVWFELKRHVQVMATYAFIVSMFGYGSLLSWEKFDPCLDSRDELRPKFLHLWWCTVITWP